MEKPEGFEIKGEGHKVYCLKNALYGLKQTLRAWNARIGKYLKDNDFIKYPYEHAVYIKKNYNGEMLIACLYVDDMLFTGSKMFHEFKYAMF